MVPKCEWIDEIKEYLKSILSRDVTTKFVPIFSTNVLLCGWRNKESKLTLKKQAFNGRLGSVSNKCHILSVHNYSRQRASDRKRKLIRT